MNKFFIISIGLILFLSLQIIYLNTHKKDQTPLLEFIKFTSFSNPAFYSNTPYLRHRDLNNADQIFTYHPSLKESAFGTFVLKSPVK